MQIYSKSLTAPMGLGVSRHEFNDMNQDILKYKHVLFASMLWVPNRQKNPAKMLSVKAVLTLNSSASSVNLKVIGSESWVSCTCSYILNLGPGLSECPRTPSQNFDQYIYIYIDDSVMNSVQIQCEVESAICR